MDACRQTKIGQLSKPPRAGKLVEVDTRPASTLAKPSSPTAPRVGGAACYRARVLKCNVGGQFRSAKMNSSGRFSRPRTTLARTSAKMSRCVREFCWPMHGHSHGLGWPSKRLGHPSSWSGLKPIEPQPNMGLCPIVNGLGHGSRVPNLTRFGTIFNNINEKCTIHQIDKT